MLGSFPGSSRDNISDADFVALCIDLGVTIASFVYLVVFFAFSLYLHGYGTGTNPHHLFSRFNSLLFLTTAASVGWSLTRFLEVASAHDPLETGYFHLAVTFFMGSMEWPYILLSWGRCRVIIETSFSDRVRRSIVVLIQFTPVITHGQCIPLVVAWIWPQTKRQAALAFSIWNAAAACFTVSCECIFILAQQTQLTNGLKHGGEEAQMERMRLKVVAQYGLVAAAFIVVAGSLFMLPAVIYNDEYANVLSSLTNLFAINAVLTLFIMKYQRIKQSIQLPHSIKSPELGPLFDQARSIALEDALARNHSHNVLSLAILDRTNDLIAATPFNKVSLDLRCTHEMASICHCLCLLDHYFSTETALPASSTILESAIAVLDKTLLTSGAPQQSSLIHDLIDLINPLIHISPPKHAPAIDTSITTHPPITNPIQICLNPPSLNQFKTHVTTQKPCIIKNALDHWPALSTPSDPRTWTVDSLRSRFGSRIVPVETGSKYTEDSWSQRIMTMQQFIDTFIYRESGLGADDGDAQSVLSESNGSENGWGDGAADEQVVARNTTKRSINSSTPEPRKCPKQELQIGYLAQHTLFSQIPALYNDIAIPEYCYHQMEEDTHAEDESWIDEDIKISAWFGPCNTVSPLHTDPQNNLFAQVMGRKYVRLYAPSETAKVYPYPEGLLKNTSQVDVEIPDLEKYPNFDNAEFLDCVVGPGDMLFIPRGWWHYVKSLDTSFSVSFWF
ncbi:Lysine-specific demethylase 8 [Chytriomyces hyalinus]|nr:Lysine-specific demethylase 8 [Chytriomyces hyalinus]